MPQSNLPLDLSLSLSLSVQKAVDLVYLEFTIINLFNMNFSLTLKS